MEADSGNKSFRDSLNELKEEILKYEYSSLDDSKSKVEEACETLVQLLPSNSASVQITILMIVSEVKESNPENFQKLFLDKNIVHVLVELVCNSSSKVREVSYIILKSIYKDENEQALNNDVLQVIPQLLEQLDFTNKEVFAVTKSHVYVLKLLLLLSFKKDSVILFKKFRVLNTLRPYLTTHNNLINQKVYEILVNLSYQNMSIVEDFLELNMIGIFVPMLAYDIDDTETDADGVSRSELQLYVLYIFANITRGSGDQNMAIVSSEFLRSLMKFLGSKDPQTVESAAAIVGNLSRSSHQLCESLLRYDCFRVSLQLLGSSTVSIGVKGHLLRFVSTLSKGPEKHRKIVSSCKIMTSLEMILQSLHGSEDHQNDMGKIEIYSNILDITLMIVIANKYQKQYFFEHHLLNLLLPLLNFNEDSLDALVNEKSMVLRKSLVKFLLSVSKNAKEYNMEIIQQNHILDVFSDLLEKSNKMKVPKTPLQNLELELTRLDLDKAPFSSHRAASPAALSVSSATSNYQTHVFDLLTIVYSICINCKQSFDQRIAVIQNNRLYKLLLNFCGDRYNFKIRYISCELLNLMLKFDKEYISSFKTSPNLQSNMPPPPIVNSFYDFLEMEDFEIVVKNFVKDHNGAEIDSQLISIISYSFLRETGNKQKLVKCMDNLVIKNPDFLAKLSLVMKGVNINVPSSYPLISNIILIFYRIFEVMSEKHIQQIPKDYLAQMLSFFKNVIGILTMKTGDDPNSFKIVELTVRTIKEFSKFTPREKQLVISSGLLGILTLYLYSFTNEQHLKLLPLTLDIFANIAAGNETQKQILCTKYTLLSFLLSLLMNTTTDKVNSMVVKEKILKVLDNLSANASAKIHDLIFKIEFHINLIDLLDYPSISDTAKIFSIGTLSNLASGNNYQKEELIKQNVLLPIHDILEPLCTYFDINNKISNKISSTGETDSIREDGVSKLNKVLLNQILNLLVNLSSGDSNLSLQLINSGYLKLLYELISCSTSLIIHEKIVRIIRNVSNGSVNHSKAISANFLIGPLSSLLNTKKNKTYSMLNIHNINEDLSDPQITSTWKSIDIHIIWTFVNISRFDDGDDKMNVLNNGIMFSLPKLITLKIHTKDDKDLQKAIASLLNNFVQNRDCMNIILYKHSEFIVQIIDMLKEYSETMLNREREVTGGKIENDATKDNQFDLIVLLLNFLSNVSKVDDIKYRRFLTSKNLVKVMDTFTTVNMQVIQTLSFEIISNLKGFDTAKKKVPSGY